jgi:hypothetical protein
MRESQIKPSKLDSRWWHSRRFVVEFVGLSISASVRYAHGEEEGDEEEEGCEKGGRVACW